MTKLGFITFSCTNPPIADVVARLGDGVAQIDGDVGGWSDVALPLREAVIEWQGTQPWRMTIPIMLDGFHDIVAGERRSVQPDITRLRLMGRRPAGGSQPPVVTIDGAVAGTDLSWCIESLGLDTTTQGVLRRSSDGAVIRQMAAVQLVRASFDTVNLPAAVRAAAAPKHGSTKIHAHKGDTLQKLAQHYLHDVRKWTVIRKANPKLEKAKTSPTKDLAGLTITIPPR